VEGTGCVNTAVNCPYNGTDKCVVIACDQQFGCIYTAKPCPPIKVCPEEKNFYYANNRLLWTDYQLSTTIPKDKTEPACDKARFERSQCNCELVNLYDCSIAACNATTGFCEDNEQPCFGVPDDNKTIIGAALGTAAIAGIIIAVVLGLACAGAGSAGLYNKFSDSDSASIHSNPLYDSAAKGGENPLHDA
jgi:hypothetical protein